MKTATRTAALLSLAGGCLCLAAIWYMLEVAWRPAALLLAGSAACHSVASYLHEKHARRLAAILRQRAGTGGRP